MKEQAAIGDIVCWTSDNRHDCGVKTYGIVLDVDFQTDITNGVATTKDYYFIKWMDDNSQGWCRDTRETLSIVSKAGEKNGVK